MNEATLEARLNAELTNLFPTIDKIKITHQKSFTLQLGHNIIVNDYEKTEAGGRADVLVSYDDRPLAIVELKRPGKKIEQPDVDQGLSYARLLTPMPPLVVISNGTEVQYYKTFNKEKWQPQDVNEEAIQSLFNYGLACAEADHDEAIKILIGQQPHIWKAVFTNYTKESLDQLEGELDDFSHPIPKDFTIRRTLTSDIYKEIQRQPLVTILGAPLSGKTSIIHQLCNLENSKLVPLYIDAATSYGVLQKIANQFCQNLFKQTNVDNVRHWIINSFRSKPDNRFTLIIDNLSLLVSDSIWREIHELIDINTNNEFNILLVMDEYCFKQVSQSLGRPTKNSIGRSSVVNVKNLSDEEFEGAQYEFLRKLHALFHNGAQYNVDYRNPRLLRLIAAGMGKKTRSKSADDSAFTIPSITTIEILSDVWKNYITDTVLQTDMRYLVKTFLDDKSARKEDPVLAIMSLGRGAVRIETAESVLGSERINRLIKQGYIQQFNLNGGRAYILPKFPEALSAAASFFASDSLIEMYRRKEYSEAYEFLTTSIAAFPYGDLVAALAIVEACKVEPEMLSYLVPRLFDNEPKASKPEHGNYMAYFEDVGEIKIHGEDGITISNWLPWLILSHIASLPLGDESGNRHVQLQIIAGVGSYKNILMRIDYTPIKDMKGFHTHDVNEDSTIICGKVGIIEPITLAMQYCFYQIPEEMIKLCNYAIEEKQFNLSARINLAAYSTRTCQNKAVKDCSELAIELTSAFMKEYTVESFETCKESHKVVGNKKIGRNEECPCGSGLKYKKCHGK